MRYLVIARVKPGRRPALDKPADYGNAFAEFQQFFDLGVDGVFTDNPDIAKAVRDDE